MKAEEAEGGEGMEEDAEVITTEAVRTEQKALPMETCTARSDKAKAKARGRSES